MIARWLINAGTLLGLAYLLHGIVVGGVVPALVAAAVLGIVNAFIRPLLLVLTLPLNIITLGLFTFVINGLMLWLVSALVPGFSVNGLLTAIIGSLLLSIISGILTKLVKD